MVASKEFPGDPLKIAKRGPFPMQSEKRNTYGKTSGPTPQYRILPLTHTHQKAPDDRQIVDPTTYLKKQAANGGPGPTNP